MASSIDHPFISARYSMWDCGLIDSYGRTILFCNRILSEFGNCSITVFSRTVLYKDWEGERKMSRVCLGQYKHSCTKLSDHPQRLCRVFPIIQCAFGAHLDLCLAERSTPCRFTGTLHISLPLSGNMVVFGKTSLRFRRIPNHYSTSDFLFLLPCSRSEIMTNLKEKTPPGAWSCAKIWRFFFCPLLFGLIFLVSFSLPFWPPPVPHNLFLCSGKFLPCRGGYRTVSLISGTKGPPVPSKSKNARSGVFTQEQIKQKCGIGGGYRNIGQITTGSPRKAYFSGAFPTPGNYSSHKTGTGKSIFSY